VIGKSMVLGALALAMVASVVAAAPAFAGGGGHGCRETSLSAEAGQSSVEMKANCFRSAAVRVEAGTTVTWRNLDGWEHAIDGVGADWGSEQLIATGEAFSRRFDEVGVFPYYCKLHSGMIGTVIVADGATEQDPAGLGVVSVEAASTGPPGAAWLLTGLLAGVLATAGATFARSRR